MSSKTPIVLLLLAILLGAYVLLFERDRPKQSEIEARDGFLVPMLVRDRVSHVVIETGETRTELFREGEGFDETWTLGATDGPEAEIDAVYNYLRDWEYAMPTRTLERPSAEDLDAFGLSTPRASVLFGMGQSEVSVTLGSGEPVDSGGYVRVGDLDHAVVVPKSVVELFDVEPTRFEIKNDGGAPLLEDLLDAERGNENPEGAPHRAESDGTPAPAAP